MKYAAHIFLLLSFTLTQAQITFEETVVEPVETVELDWITNFSEAKKQARKLNKPILVYFTGSDWCTPCKNLKEDFFETKDFQDAALDYVIVYLDIPARVDIISLEARAENKKAQKKLNVTTFPTLLALDKNGKERNRIERYSYRDTQYYWSFMTKNERLF